MAFAYGPNNQAFVITLTSLGNGSGQQSDEVDNTSQVYDDILVVVKIKTNAAGTSANGSISIYGIGTVDGGSNRTDGAGASNAAITIAGAPVIGTGAATANSTTYIYGPFSVAKAFGGVMPAKWAIAVVNNSGAALDASIGAAAYQPVRF